MTGFEKRGEDFLDELNRAFRQGEDSVVCENAQPTKPVVLVVGAPRSGTTLLTQWLSYSGFGVPTNLLARLYQTPYLGGLVQRLLTDPELNYRNELAVEATSSFASEAGKTAGLLAPHEFFYFWRRFLPLDVARPMTPEERRSADPAGLASGLARLEAALSRPLAMKAIIAQYDLDLVDSVLPTAIYVHTVRDEVDNVESLLRIRATVHGDESEWFSVRPSGSELVETMSPVMQAAAQVAWTNDDIRESLSAISAERVLHLDHSTFCESPGEIRDELAAKCAVLGVELGPFVGPESFSENRRASKRSAEITEALNHVRGMDRPRKET